MSLFGPAGSRFRVKLTRFRWQESTRPFCRLSGTEGGEEDTGCTHQTPSLATLFNPLTPLPHPLYLSIVFYACVITIPYEREVSYRIYRVTHSRIFFFFDSFPFSLKIFLSQFLKNRFKNSYSKIISVFIKHIQHNFNWDWSSENINS